MRRILLMFTGIGQELRATYYPALLVMFDWVLPNIALAKVSDYML